MSFFFTLEFFLLLVMLGSAGALILFVRRKIKLISTSEQIEAEEEIDPAFYLSQIREYARKAVLVRSRLSLEILLQTFLSKIRVIAIKIDYTTSRWLDSLRKRTQQRKEQFSESYWKQLKKPKPQKRKKRAAKPD